MEDEEIYEQGDGNEAEHPCPQPVPTDHARVLLRISGDPHALMADIADRVGVRERSVQQIVTDLERAGYLTRHRTGRRNTYTVHRDLPFRHRTEAGHEVGDLLDLLSSPAQANQPARTFSVVSRTPCGPILGDDQGRESRRRPTAKKVARIVPEAA